MSSTQAGMTQSAYGKRAGKIEMREAELASRQIELEATAREADRKSQLAEMLAASIAQTGVAGVAAYEGSPLSVLEESIKAEGKDTQRDIYMSQLEALTERYRGRIAYQEARSIGRQAEKAGRSGTARSIMSFGLSTGGN